MIVTVRVAVLVFVGLLLSACADEGARSVTTVAVRSADPAAIVDEQNSLEALWMPRVLAACIAPKTVADPPVEFDDALAECLEPFGGRVPGRLEGPLVVGPFPPRNCTTDLSICEYLEPEGGGAVEVHWDGECVSPMFIWPAGTTWQEEPPAVILPDGQALPPGTRIWTNGGSTGFDGLFEGSENTWTEIGGLMERCGRASHPQPRVMTGGTGFEYELP